MPRYLLAHHVFVCVEGEYVVFLDVRKDRYFALESAKTAGLGSVVPGWPVPAQLDVNFALQGGVRVAATVSEQAKHVADPTVISLLLEKGILVSAPENGKRADVIVAEPLRGDLASDDHDGRPRVGLRQVLRFTSSVIRARLLIRNRTFEALIERVRRRAEQRRPRAVPVPDPELRQLIESFSRLKPFFFAAKNACLLDALSLSEFLAGYGVFPSWVFGVQSRPFAAHCWLQLDGIVLNDSVDHVKRYTPIMIV